MLKDCFEILLKKIKRIDSTIRTQRFFSKKTKGSKIQFKKS